MADTDNNIQKITSAFLNGTSNIVKKTSSYVVKEANVTSTTFEQIPQSLRTSLPFKGVDIIGQRLLLEGGGPVRIGKGDLYRIYNSDSGVTTAFVLGTDDNVLFFDNSNPGVLIDAMKKSEEAPAPASQPN